jgi:hypothetical protein
LMSGRMAHDDIFDPVRDAPHTRLLVKPVEFRRVVEGILGLLQEGSPRPS